MRNDNGKYCPDCGKLMRYRRKTKDYACTFCPKVVPEDYWVVPGDPR